MFQNFVKHIVLYPFWGCLRCHGQHHGLDTHKSLFESRKPRCFGGSGASPAATLGVIRGCPLRAIRFASSRFSFVVGLSRAQFISFCVRLGLRSFHVVFISCSSMSCPVMSFDFICCVVFVVFVMMDTRLWTMMCLSVL